MLESLLVETVEILSLTEKETGEKIRLEAATLPYSGSSNIVSYYAGRGSDGIKIRYDTRARSIDYVIAHEAGRILRFVRAPPDERYALGSTSETRRVAYAAMEEDLANVSLRIKTVSRQGFPFFYDELLRQLVSMPGDFWINKWLLDNYPSFRGEIEIGLKEIFSTAHQALQREIEVLTPRCVYVASNAMNAAFGVFASELTGNFYFGGVYRGNYLEKVAASLLKHNMSA